MFLLIKSVTLLQAIDLKHTYRQKPTSQSADSLMLSLQVFVLYNELPGTQGGYCLSPKQVIIRLFSIGFT